MTTSLLSLKIAPQMWLRYVNQNVFYVSRYLGYLILGKRLEGCILQSQIARWLVPVFDCIVLYCIVLYCIVLYQYCIVFCCILLYFVDDTVATLCALSLPRYELINTFWMTLKVDTDEAGAVFVWGTPGSTYSRV